jgi:Ras-related GTP-binding protein A/B
MKIKEIFATSIWDETLYKAWSKIVQFLIPNLSNVQENLLKFCEICDCDEIVLFEKTTFLIIAHHALKKHKDKLRFERMSNIVKQFKLSCQYYSFLLLNNPLSKMGAMIKQIQVKNQFFNAYIQEFTNNTYIMVVVSKSKIQDGAIMINIECARNFFANNKSTEI